MTKFCLYNLIRFISLIQIAYSACYNYVDYDNYIFCEPVSKGPSKMHRKCIEIHIKVKSPQNRSILIKKPCIPGFSDP